MLHHMDACVQEPWGSPKFLSFARGGNRWRAHRQELAVLLNTPGFSSWFWAAVFRRQAPSIGRLASELRASVSPGECRRNFLSVSADDAIQLAIHAADARRGYQAPYFVRLAAIECVNRGMSQAQAGKLVGFSTSTVGSWVQLGPGEFVLSDEVFA